MLQLIGKDLFTEGAIPCVVSYNIPVADVEECVTKELCMNEQDLN